jgi:hypothetical protein
LSIWSDVMKKLTGPLLVMGSAGERADLLYASGFSALDPVVFLQHGRQRMLVVPVLELGRAREETRRLYYPGLGGVRIEDTVLITRQGYRCPATFPKKFIL